MAPAAIPVPRPFYGSVHPAILGDFQCGRGKRSLQQKTGPAAVVDLVPSFGLRYQIDGETAAVIITGQRRLRGVLTGNRECVVCTDTKPVSAFPAATITKACTHEPGTCLVCVATSIRTDLHNRLWSEIKCPECSAALEYDDVQQFADEQTRERYQALSFRSSLSSSPSYFWCTAASCNHGQLHSAGAGQPIVICHKCGARSCFVHRIPWHDDLTCAEFNGLIADPTGFLNQFERERKEMEETRARELRELALRRKKEEDASQRTVGATTRPCPGCGAPIERSEGCPHMTCTKCRCEFCWRCGAPWSRAHSGNCPLYEWTPRNRAVR